MMLPLSISLLAVCWLFLPPSRFPDLPVFYYCVAGAFLAAVAGKQRASAIIPRGWSSLPAAIVLLIFYFIWDSPTGLGALILAAGILLGSLLGGDRLVRRFTDGLTTVGAVLLLQLAGSYLYYFVVGPRAHDAAPWSSLLHAILNVLGINSGVSTAGIHLVLPDILYQVAPTLNNMGIFFFLQVFIGLIVLVALGRIRAGALWRGALILFVYMLLRYAALMVYDISRSNQGTYWWPSTTAWTSVWVFAFLRGKTFAPKPGRSDGQHPFHDPKGSWRRAAVLVGCTIVTIIAWTMVQAYVDPGRQKQGRLLIDEHHSDWEWTEMKFDTLWYGQQSTYNFYSGAEFWGKYYDLERGHADFTLEYLKQYDVVCLKVPTRPYKPAEIEAVRQYVADGGGLVLIGDHTNVFGHATFLNQISEMFGLYVHADIAYEVVTGDLNVYQMPKTLPHPVVQNLPLFLWGGQCTLRGDAGVKGVMVDMNIKTLPADYSERNFFPERVQHADYRFGPFFSVASCTYGKGRIICFTDSTLISNFFIFIPGKPELMLGLVEYANREERFPGWRMFLTIVGGFSLLIGLIVAGSFGARGFIWMLAAGLTTFIVIAPRIEQANRDNYPLPEPKTPYKQLIFEGEYSQYFIPELRLANNQDKDFHTFFVWTQRVDVYPRKYYSFDKCVAEARKLGALLMIDPGKVPTPEQMERLKSYIHEGGTLVVVDDPENGRVPTNTLLKDFGLEMDFINQIAPSNLSQYPAASIWNNAAPIRGGTPLYISPDGAPVVAEARYGKGRVIAYGNSRSFERKIFGYTSMIPNAQQRAINHFAYQLMDWIFEPAGAGPALDGGPAREVQPAGETPVAR
jgi:hypothetical protein